MNIVIHHERLRLFPAYSVLIDAPRWASRRPALLFFARLFRRSSSWEATGETFDELALDLTRFAAVSEDGGVLTLNFEGDHTVGSVS